jgi:hypothetical protein
MDLVEEPQLKMTLLELVYLAYHLSNNIVYHSKWMSQAKTIPSLSHSYILATVDKRKTSAGFQVDHMS